jgi:hydroxyacylglutathione hydrolase
MLLKYFYDTALAHASYMVGCQRAKVAVVVDPGRDIDQYLNMAEREGLKLIAVAETHIHADYVSGARELADRVGAKLYIPTKGQQIGSINSPINMTINWSKTATRF